MYKLFLCLRYLLRRRVAVVPILAVMLCVAMDLIVASVMGGFLDKILESTRGLFGDVIVTENSYAGFGFYDTWIDGDGNEHPGLLQYLEPLPEVEAVTPEIETVAMLRLPRRKGFTKPVQVRGIRPAEYAAVTDFEEGLFYQNPDIPRRGEVKLYANDPAGDLVPASKLALPEPDMLYRLDGKRVPLNEATQDAAGRLLDSEGEPLRPAPFWRNADGELIDTLGNRVDLSGERMAPPRAAGYWSGPPSFYHWPSDDPAEPPRPLGRALDDGADRVGTFVGTRILFSTPNKYGVFERDMFPPGDEPVQLTMQPIFASGVLPQPVMKQFYMVDTSYTRIPQIDQATVYVPFDQLQSYMVMDASEAAGSSGFRSPARTTRVLIRLKGRSDTLTAAEQAAGVAAVNEAVARWKADLEAYWEALGPEARADMAYYMPDAVQVRTWQEANSQFFVAIANQRFIALLMVGVVSLTAIALVWVIFMMIVVEKTRDIGIVKSVGGSATGVAMIFLTWAAVIGLIGAALGDLLGWAFVQNINSIEQWLSGVLGTDLFNPEAYLFESIPARVESSEVAIITIAAMLAAMLGSLLPAVRAARMNPVESLRYE